MLVLSMILFQRSEAELRGRLMKEEVNSFIMECNSSPSSLYRRLYADTLVFLFGGSENNL